MSLTLENQDFRDSASWITFWLDSFPGYGQGFPGFP